MAKKLSANFDGGVSIGFVTILIVNPPFEPLTGLAYLLLCGIVCAWLSPPLTKAKEPL